jgi:urease accessory protein
LPAGGEPADDAAILLVLTRMTAKTDTVRLSFDARSKSRLLLKLDGGEEAALVVERGRLLRGGDRVRTQDGREVEIIAADESLLEASSEDPAAIAKAAFHLGNRHVAVQVMANRLRFLNDHVLEQMVRGLGLDVTAVHAPFEPEGGAYGHHHVHGSQLPLITPKIHEFR